MTTAVGLRIIHTEVWKHPMQKRTLPSSFVSVSTSVVIYTHPDSITVILPSQLSLLASQQPPTSSYQSQDPKQCGKRCQGDRKWPGTYGSCPFSIDLNILIITMMLIGYSGIVLTLGRVASINTCVKLSMLQFPLRYRWLSSLSGVSYQRRILYSMKRSVTVETVWDQNYSYASHFRVSEWSTANGECE